MKILLTGAGSFTGYWFASALQRAGHSVVAPLRGMSRSYDGLKRERIAHLSSSAQVVDECPFGSERFLEVLREDIDVLCHHAALVTNYKSPDFDVNAAVANNTFNLQSILRVGGQSDLKAVVLTGSVFEANEGAGSTPLRAFSPYGLSKGLTAEIFRFWCAEQGIPLVKFVIPNPFGPWEEERFCAYLMRNWADGKVAAVNTPAYVRDNIHVSLLALAYVDIVQKAGDGPEFFRYAPSGYVESQGAFANRVAHEIGSRLGLKAALSLARQTKFTEPKIRINTEIPDAEHLGWDEAGAWDTLADYYRLKYLSVG